MELVEVSVGDIFSNCDVCGDGHETEFCPQLGYEDNLDSGTVNLTRAIKTVPNNLKVEKQPDGRLTIVAVDDIEINTRFGPFEAILSLEDIDDDGVFVLKVFNKDGSISVLDTSDESSCNWLALVNCAPSLEQQNCMAFQVGASIFYSVTQPIKTGDELLVWYAKFYSKKLGKLPEPNGITCTMLERKYLKPYLSSDAFLNDADMHESISSLEDQVKMEPIKNLSNSLSDDTAPVELEVDGHYECDRCGVIIYKQSLFADHVRTHFESNRTRHTKKFSCSQCKISFTNASNLDRHKRIHSADERRYECDQCNFYTYRTDFMHAHTKRQHGVNWVCPNFERKRLFKHQSPKEPVPKRKRGRPRKVLLQNSDNTKCNSKHDSVEICETYIEYLGNNMLSEAVAAGVKNSKEDNLNEKEVKVVDTDGLDVLDNLANEQTESSSEEFKNCEQKPGTELIRRGNRVRCTPAKFKEFAELSSIKSKINGPKVEAPLFSSVKSDEIPLVSEKGKRGRKKGSKNKPKYISENVLIEGEMSPATRILPSRKNRGAKMLELVHKPVLISENKGECNEVGIVDNENVKILPEDEDSVVDVQCEDDDGDESWKGLIKISGVLGDNNTENVHGLRKRGRKPKPIDMENIITNNELEGNESPSYTCKICLKVFDDLKRCSVHMKTHNGMSLCKLCGQVLNCKKDPSFTHECKPHRLMIVETVDENGENLFVCVECNETFKSLDASQKHYLSHSGEFTCKLCYRRFDKQHLLMNHVCAENASDEIEGEFPCAICKQTFRYARYLYRHMAIHTSTFKCNSCGRCFSRKDSMQRHILSCDPGRCKDESIFQCPRCGRPFSTESGLDNHSIKCMKNTCINCGIVFLSEEELDYHDCPEPDKIYTGKPKFDCLLCQRSFANAKFLQKHALSHSGYFSCSQCAKTFDKKHEEHWHFLLCYGQAAIDSGDGAVSCLNCAKVFSDASSYRDHMILYTNPHKCTKCDKYFRREGSLCNHSCVDPQLGENLNQCQICKKQFRSERYLQRHMIVHKRPEYKCDTCGKTFHRPDFIYEHTCRLADGTWARVCRRKSGMFIREGVVCDLCGKLFSNRSNLTKHRVTHGDRENECRYCHKKFHHYNYLKEHEATVHENNRSITCSKCSKVLKSKASLLAHINQFHRDNQPHFTCHTCGKSFRQKGNLKCHMFSHSADKTFRCQFCLKYFKYPDQLARHKLQHTMADKLVCSICDKKFVKIYELKAHVALFHSGQFYICNLCDAKCTHRHTIIRHFKRKHPMSLHMLQKQGFIDSLLRDRPKEDFSSTSWSNRPADIHNPRSIISQNPPSSLPEKFLQILTPAPDAVFMNQINFGPGISGAGEPENDSEQFVLSSGGVVTATDSSGRSLRIPDRILSNIVDDRNKDEPTMVILQIVNEDGMIEEVQGQIEGSSIVPNIDNSDVRDGTSLTNGNLLHLTGHGVDMELVGPNVTDFHLMTDNQSSAVQDSTLALDRSQFHVN